MSLRRSPGFPFVPVNDFRFNHHRVVYHSLYGFRAHGQNLLHVFFQIAEKAIVRDGGMFNNFRQAASSVPLRECLQNFGITNDKLGLIEYADHVFVTGKINAVFPARTGIHLGQQCGCHKPEPDTPQVGRGHEAGDIAYDAPADPHNKNGSIRFLVHQFLKNILDRLKGFDTFPHADFNDPAFRKLIPVKMPDILVGDDDR